MKAGGSLLKGFEAPPYERVGPVGLALRPGRSQRWPSPVLSGRQSSAIRASIRSTGRPVLIAVRSHNWRRSAHSLICTAGDLRLVDLTRLGRRQIGIGRNALLAGPTVTSACPRAWAETSHAGSPRSSSHFLYISPVWPGLRRRPVWGPVSRLV